MKIVEYGDINNYERHYELTAFLGLGDTGYVVIDSVGLIQASYDTSQRPYRQIIDELSAHLRGFDCISQIEDGILCIRGTTISDGLHARACAALVAVWQPMELEFVKLASPPTARLT